MTAMVWLACSVPLGRRTLYQHLRAIFATQEAQDLADGTKQEARDLAKRVQKGIAEGRDKKQVLPATKKTRTAAPLDPMDEKDQQALEHLVHEKTR